MSETTLFRFRAVDRAGVASRVELAAGSEAEALATLKRRGLIVLGRAERRRFDLAALLATEIGGSRLSASERTDFTREIASMLAAGLDLERALRFAAEITPRARARTLITGLCALVRDGASFARALSAEPSSFPPIYIGLVRAGEESGAMTATLDDLARLLERSRSMHASIVASLTYPALLLVASIGAIGFLLTEVLPQFVAIFAANGAHLPQTTQMLLAIGAFCGLAWPWVLAGAMPCLLTARWLLRHPRVRLRVDALLLRVPVLGSLLREALAARLTRTLGTLLCNGVALVPALAIVGSVIGNRAATAAVTAAGEAARGGKGLARGLEAAGLLPVRAIYLLRLGEETGQLGPMALRAAAVHEERTRLQIEKLVALLVPLITVALGGVIGFIITALLLAMLGLNGLAH
jgi:general secretion pathway protein F